MSAKRLTHAAMIRHAHGPRGIGRFGWCAWAVLLLVVGQVAAPARAEVDARRVTYVPQIANEVEIDGALDEAAWDRAARVYPARVGNLSPINPTTARVFWDQTHLYVGFEGFDYDVRATLTERDSHVWDEGDCFELFLVPPSNDEIERIEMQINPNAALLDIGWLEGRPFEEALAWHWAGARWAVQVDGTLNDERQDRGWSAELALPWAALEAAGVVKPRPGDAWPGLLTFINRARLPTGRTARELASWPVLSVERYNRVNEYGELRFVGPDGAPIPVEGFAELILGSDRQKDPLRADDRGMGPWWLLDPDEQAVAWRTRPVPKTIDSTVTFMFRAQSIGRGEPSSQAMALYLDGERLVAFEPHIFEDRTWTRDRATLAYHHRGGRKSSGVYELTVPAEHLEPGEPATLRIEPVDEVNDFRFALRAWHDAARFEYHHQRWNP
ncbi:MAG: carbohydrate-binding family 9-like protein [Phycisphaeraceae bacterium]